MSTETLEPVAKSELPEPVQRRGINEAQWRTLAKNLYPGADPLSVLMVIDYCQSRHLDPLKKPCHIVPMKVKDVRSGEWGWRDVVMPGIYEYRITAQRTGLYHGHTKPTYGPTEKHAGVDAPAWCEMTFFRWNDLAGRVVEFPVQVFFREVVALKDGHANERWSKAPIQMLTKCTEAAGLRETFPEEFGGEATAEEMDGQGVIEAEVAADPVQPAQRKSQSTNGQTPATAATTTAPAPVAAPEPAQPAAPAVTPAPVSSSPTVGTVTDVKDKGGAWLIKLSTGYQCATRDAELARAAEALQAKATRAEFVTRPATNPRNAPILTEIQPLGEQA